MLGAEGVGVVRGGGVVGNREVGGPYVMKKKKGIFLHFSSETKQELLLQTRWMDGDARSQNDRDGHLHICNLSLFLLSGSKSLLG